MALGLLRHGIGGERGIDMAVIGLVDTAEQAIQGCQRMQFGDAFRIDDFQRIAGEL